MISKKPQTRYDELEAKFQKLHHDKPHIYDAFEKWAFRLISDGRTHLSSAMILSLIRSDPLLRSKSGKKLGLDQNLSAFFAQKFAAEYPQHSKVFKVRKQESKDSLPLKTDSGSRQVKGKAASKKIDMNRDSIKRSA